MCSRLSSSHNLCKAQALKTAPSKHPVIHLINSLMAEPHVLEERLPNSVIPRAIDLHVSVKLVVTRNILDSPRKYLQTDFLAIKTSMPVLFGGFIFLLDLKIDQQSTLCSLGEGMESKEIA